MFEDVMVFPETDFADVETGVGSKGFGEVLGMQSILMSDNPLGNLRKALEAGYGTSPDTKTGGGAFRIESLQPTLKQLTYTEFSTALFNDLMKDKKDAQSTVEEYSKLTDISEAFTYVEGGLPAQEDDTYQRDFEYVKYIGAVGQVSNVILRTKNIVEAREREIKTKMLAIKKKANVLAYFGDASTCATEPNGLHRSIVKAGLSSTNIIDLRGKRPTLEKINEGINVIEDVAGYTVNLRMYMSPRAKRNYKNELLKDKRYVVGGEFKAEVEGLKADTLVHDGGEMPIRKDIFLNPPKSPRLSADKSAFVSTGDKPPAKPTVVVVAEPDTSSRLETGTYDYIVVAKNQYGHLSVPSDYDAVGSTNITIAANERAKITVTEGSSPSGQTATAYLIYRRKAADTSLSDFRYLFTVSATGGEYYDDGTYLPDCGSMFLIDWDTDQTLAWHQLMDAALFPLGSVADSIRWLQRLYGTLIVYNPKKIVEFINVGDEPVSA